MNDRIALFLPSLLGGGAERVMLRLARGLVDQAIPVDLVLAHAEGSYLQDVPAKVRLVDLKAKRVLASLPHLIGYLRKERPRAMLSTLMHANVVALWARRLGRVQTRLLVREVTVVSRAVKLDSDVRSRMLPYLARYTYPWADKIVAVSQGAADDLAQVLRISRDRIDVIYNPVDRRELLEKSKEPVGHPWLESGELPVVLGIGRLTKQKDFATLIRAFALVRKQIRSRLVILGEGEQRPELEALVGELNLEQDVSLPGFAGNPYAYLRRASVFVLSSILEGLPNALIEALAVGTPVVATDCESGPREILEGGRYGRLTSVSDPSALASGILDVMKNRNLFIPATESLQKFSQNVCLSKYMQGLQGGVDQ